MNINDIKHIRIEDFDYPLPDERIARHPLAERDNCLLITADADGNIGHHRFHELPDLLCGERETPIMVCNETKVINARMEFFKQTGSRIEIFLLEPDEPADYVQSFATDATCVWSCMVGNLKKWKSGPLTKELEIEGVGKVTLEAILLPEEGEMPRGGSHRIQFRWTEGVSFASIVEAAGNIPIPPYLKRESEESDTEDYQTVFSRVKGSVAAPTAGLHFTDALLDSLRDEGVDIEKVTLHVGAGTFQPVKSDNIGDHPMHTETIDVPLKVIERLIDALENGRTVLAVGTTSVRTLESLPFFGLLAATRDVSDPDAMHVDQWLAYSDGASEADTLTLMRRLRDALRAAGLDSLRGSTQIMIAPGFRWRIVGKMVTNFHQPESTLLLLVSSFLEPGNPTPKRWREIYDRALEGSYRFLSYGDACLFERGDVFDSNSRERGEGVELPLSKSIALRAMILDAVSQAQGKAPVDFTRLPDSEDVEGLARALKALRDGDKEVFIGEGGAPMRFFTALAAATPGCDITVSGSDRLMKRPIGILLDALRKAGADIECLGDDDLPPLRIRGRRLRAGRIAIDAGVSSQFISALMLTAPLRESPLQISFEGRPLVSAPYIRMTAEIMARFGVKADVTESGVSVAPQECVPPATFAVETDWSAASYLYETALIMDTYKPIEIASLTPPEISLQGDSACADILGPTGVDTLFHSDGSATLITEGCLRAKRVITDLGDTPDLVPALCVGFALAGIEFEFNNIAHLRLKESDRLSALQTEMRKLGYVIQSDGSNLVWHGERCEAESAPVISTYSDHRMAMAFAPAALCFPALRIENPEVVRKSFPSYWDVMASLGVKPHFS